MLKSSFGWQAMPNYDPTMKYPRTFGQMLVYGSFYGIFLAMGVVITWLPMWYFELWQQWRMNNVFIETSGEIIGKRIVQGEFGPICLVEVRYIADGRQLQNWNRLSANPGLPDFDAIKIGEQRQVWFDPAKPDDVIVHRDYVILWWLFGPMLILGLLLMVGSGHTIFRGLTSWLSTGRND